MYDREKESECSMERDELCPGGEIFAYVGEILLMKLAAESPELGIQLLRKYHSQGIGTQVMKLFIDKLKSVLQAAVFSVRMLSENYLAIQPIVSSR